MNETPKSLLCIAGIGCPALYRTDRGTFIVVGKKLDEVPPEIARTLAASPDETAIEIPVSLLSELSEKPAV